MKPADAQKVCSPTSLGPLAIAIALSVAPQSAQAADANAADGPLHPWRLQASLFGTPLFSEDSLGTDGHYGDVESGLFFGADVGGRYEATRFVSLELGIAYELLWGAPPPVQRNTLREGDVRLALRVPLSVLRFGDDAFEIVPEVAPLWGWTSYKYDAQGNTFGIAGPSVRLAVRYLHMLGPKLGIRFDVGPRIDMLGFSPSVGYFTDALLGRAAILATIGVDFAP
ncbi:MAG TPA: hypothetical protein VK550_31535 [Polyangiaceae bacterium]|nr:hypothetical protein [Polyangiaceae bacterium]